jgi:hypothetical protein
MRNISLPFILVIIILIPILTSSTLHALPNKAIKVDFAFDDLEFHKFRGYDVVKIKDCLLTMNIGEPKLPLKTKFIFIPNSSEVIDIEFSSEREEIEGKFNIYPNQPPAITSIMNQNFIFNHTIYNSSDPYPKKCFEYHVGKMRDHKIVTISVYPLQYIPIEGKIVFHRIS